MIARITVTLPAGLVEEIDRLERNRSAFVAKAVEREIRRRRRAGLRRSLREPHAESVGMAGMGLRAWARGLPCEEIRELVDPGSGVAVRWRQGEGWTRGRK